MKTQTLIARIICPETMAGRFTTTCATKLLPLLLLLALPAVVQAQFGYTTNNGTITIQDISTGPGGAVTIPSTINGLPVTSIGDYAFSEESLTSVTIPNSVTSIGNYAFMDCGGLTNVMIGDGVTNIGAFAFMDCTNLTSVHFEGNAPTADPGVLLYDNNATVYYLSGTTGWGTTFAGHPAVLWNAVPQGYTCTTNNGMITITGYTGPGGAVTIPGTICGLPVTSIWTNAFLGCTTLTSITIPSSVISIGDCAFAGCTNLADVYFRGNAPSLGSSVFSGDNNVTVYYVVSGFNYTKTDGAITITRYTGSGGAVVIPSTINGLPVTSIGDDAINNCDTLTSITIPDSVTSIGAQAFGQDYGLINVTIPNSVTNIGDSGFGWCTRLTSVTIGDSVTSIADGTFAYCSSLIGITIPNSVTSIGVQAFDFCGSLTSITIPDSVTSIAEDAFASCTSLASVTIPDSVTNIGEAAFVYCSGLTGITIPDSVTSIGDSVFESCSSLTSVTIGKSVTSIGEAAFAYCSALTSVTIGDSVTNIGDYAFDGCSSLSSVHFQGNAPSVDSYVFEDDDPTVYYLPGTTGWGTTFGGVPAVLWSPPVQGCIYTTNGGTITITAYVGSGGAVTIPAVINGLPVTSIASRAFSHRASVTSVTIPNSVTSIGEGVFYGCTGLGSVTIPNSVTSIGDSAFDGCYDLTSVTIGDSVTSIGANAFCDCSLTSITIPNSVSSIGTNAFQGCVSLTGAYFQGNAPNADSSVFSGDSNATVYYLAGTTGWGPTFSGRPASLSLPPSILTPPLTQTAEMGSVAGFWVEVTNAAPETTYEWYFDGTNALGSTTNCYLVLPSVQPAQAGAYMVVVTNLWGAVTSAPALLSVIAPVEQRIVPALNLTGDVGSFLHLDYVDAFGPGAQWLSLSNVAIQSTPQLYFDLSEPLPAQRFYRASQTNVPSARPALDMRLATEIPLSGAIGSSVQIDYINQFGPTGAWVTLDTVVLTNTTQLYFDVTMFRQPTRLYRLVAVP